MEFTTTHDPQERLHELMQELAMEITAFWFYIIPPYGG